MIGILTMGLSILSVLGIGLILLVPWRCIAIRKKTQVTETEWKFTKYLFYGFCVASCIVGFILMRFSNLLYLLILTAVAASLIALFALWPVYRVFNRCESEKEEEKAKKAAEQYQIPHIMTLDEMLICQEIDTILNLTTPQGHYTICKQALLGEMVIFVAEIVNRIYITRLLSMQEPSISAPKYLL